MDKQTIIKLLNDTRKANKGRGYSDRVIDDAGRFVEYKGFNTLLQSLRIDGQASILAAILKSRKELRK